MQLRFTFHFFFFSALFLLATSQKQQQIIGLRNSLVDATKPKEKIAIIGSGAGGSATAYYLQRFANTSYDITIFEKSNYIGGRSTTVNVYDNSSWYVELGASIFVSANRILMKSIEEFGLETRKYGEQIQKQQNGIQNSIGVWNGTEFILTLSDTWFSKAKLLLKYGLSPIKSLFLTKSFIGTFIEYYYEKEFPFANLTEVTIQSNFSQATNISGLSFFREKGISDSYSFDFIQSISRVNYAQNLEDIHGIGALVSIAAENAYQVKGGNWKIFEKFISYSNSTLKLNTEVTKISKTKNAWNVTYTDISNSDSASSNFDKVIIAAPLDQTDIEISGAQTPKTADYVTLHVTLFAVNGTLSEQYFFGNTTNKSKVPRTVLTTVLPEKDGIGSESLPFFSVAVNDFIEETGDYVYKIFSPKEISDEMLQSLFPIYSKISWIHRKIWKSYPKLKPISEFGNFKVDDNLWYLNIIEQFISTMETSALAGANVAALISKGKNSTELKLP